MLKLLGPLRIPALADTFVVMDADLRWVRPVAFFQFDESGAAFPTMVWTDHVNVRFSPSFLTVCQGSHTSGSSLYIIGAAGPCQLSPALL
jgi:hypothetical protein